MNPSRLGAITALIAVTTVFGVAIATSRPANAFNPDDGGIAQTVQAPASGTSAASLLPPADASPRPTVLVVGVISAVEFEGVVTIDGQPAAAGTLITALIDGLPCGTATVGNAPAGTHRIAVASHAAEPGCGRHGATVRFRVNGRMAEETATYEKHSRHPDLGPKVINLTVR